MYFSLFRPSCRLFPTHRAEVKWGKQLMVVCMRSSNRIMGLLAPQLLKLLARISSSVVQVMQLLVCYFSQKIGTMAIFSLTSIGPLSLALFISLYLIPPSLDYWLIEPCWFLKNAVWGDLCTSISASFSKLRPAETCVLRVHTSSWVMRWPSCLTRQELWRVKHGIALWGKNSSIFHRLPWQNAPKAEPLHKLGIIFSPATPFLFPFFSYHCPELWSRTNWES